MSRRLGASLIMLCFACSVNAQYELGSLDLEGNFYEWYDQQIGLEKTAILNGTYKPTVRKSTNSHTFFRNDQWQLATIRYKEQTFTGLRALYDIEEDFLVIQHPTNFSFHGFPIRLFPEQVEWFELDGEMFRNYPNGILLEPGGFFNELMVGEQISVLVKRKKNPVTSTNSSMVQLEEDHTYYLRVGSEYFRLTMFRSSFLKHFRQQKAEIRKFIRANGLQVKAGKEPDLIMVAKFCDTLLQQAK